MIEYPQRERGGGDHDQPYRFGQHPTTYLHVRQFAKLLVWRSRIWDRHLLRRRNGNTPMKEEHDVHPEQH